MTWRFSLAGLPTTPHTFADAPLGVSHDVRAAAHHDQRRGYGPSAACIRWVYFLSYVPYVLAFWIFARTYSDVDNAFYWLTCSFVFAGILIEKLWLLYHWERHNQPLMATLCALGAALCYVLASVFMGICSAGVGWQWIPAVIATGLAALWYVWLSLAQ